MTKKMKREKSHIYKKKDMDIHCEDNKQRDFCFAQMSMIGFELFCFLLYTTGWIGWIFYFT